MNISFPDNPRIYITYDSIKVDDSIKFNVTSKNICIVFDTDRSCTEAEDYVILIISLFYHDHIWKKLGYNPIIFNKMNMNTLLYKIVLRNESYYDIQSQNIQFNIIRNFNLKLEQHFAS